MDIQKEREAFEAWVIENLADGRSMSWEDWCWKSWQAAKAQAVPEGFVLIPVEPSRDAQHKIVLAMMKPAGTINDVYKAMIEAQEQK